MNNNKEWSEHELWDDEPEEDDDFNDFKASDVDANNDETFGNVEEWNEDEHEEMIAKDSILSHSVRRIRDPPRLNQNSSSSHNQRQQQQQHAQLHHNQQLPNLAAAFANPDQFPQARVQAEPSTPQILTVDELERQLMKTRIGGQQAPLQPQTSSASLAQTLAQALQPTQRINVNSMNLSGPPELSRRAGWSPFGGKDLFSNPDMPRLQLDDSFPDGNIMMHAASLGPLPPSLSLEQQQQILLQQQQQILQHQQQLQQMAFLKQQQQIQLQQLKQQQQLKQHQHQPDQPRPQQPPPVQVQQHPPPAQPAQQREQTLIPHNLQCITVEELERQMIASRSNKSSSTNNNNNNNNNNNSSTVKPIDNNNIMKSNNNVSSSTITAAQVAGGANHSRGSKSDNINNVVSMNMIAIDNSPNNSKYPTLKESMVHGNTKKSSASFGGADDSKNSKSGQERKEYALLASVVEPRHNNVLTNNNAHNEMRRNGDRFESRHSRELNNDHRQQRDNRDHKDHRDRRGDHHRENRGDHHHQERERGDHHNHHHHNNQRDHHNSNRGQQQNRRYQNRVRSIVIPPQAQLSVLDKVKERQNISVEHQDGFIKDKLPINDQGFQFTRHSTMNTERVKHDGVLTEKERDWLTRIQEKIQADYDDNLNQDYYYLLYFNRSSKSDMDEVAAAQKANGPNHLDRRFIPRERLLYNSGV